MVRRPASVGPLVALALALGAGCLDVPAAFVCVRDDQCVRAGRHGTCEPSGFCSLPDEACGSKRRYVSAAGRADGGAALAGACVDDTPGCGGSGQPCCAGNTCGSGFFQCKSGSCVARPCVDSVAAGGAFSCARRADGTAWCWGDNAFGQLGDGTQGNKRGTPRGVVGLTGDGALGGLEHVVAGAEFACAHAEQARVMYCWGRSDAGQLGNGTTAQSSRPVQVLGAQNGGPFEGVVGHVAGGHHVCVWDQDKLALWCWGDNADGQLGRGNTSTMDPKFHAPGQVLAVAPSTPFLNVIVVGAGAFHTCAAQKDDSLWCWGKNDAGQLGAGLLSAHESLPVRVLDAGKQPFGKVTALGAGEGHTCAVRDDGSVWCWGAGADGQLGDGKAVPSPAPVMALGAGSATLVGGGAHHTCALKKDARVWCWGSNGQGQLGLGGTPSAGQTAPAQPVKGLDGVVDLSVGTNHACAALVDGTVWCWGQNDSGQLGSGSGAAYSTTPVQVAIACQ